MKFNFCEPQIHQVSDIRAECQDYPGLDSGGPFARVKLIFTDAAGHEVDMPVFFIAPSIARAYQIADAINSHRVQQAAE